VAATPLAVVTGPVTLSTSFTQPAPPLTALGIGQAIRRNFNMPVSVATGWSVEVADSAANIALLNAGDATATLASGNTVLILTITATPTSVVGAEPLVSNTPWEVLDAGGISGTAAGTPAYDVAGSGGSAAAAGTATVTREILPAGGFSIGQHGPCSGADRDFGQ
jgi:hypothetical protein